MPQWLTRDCGEIFGELWPKVGFCPQFMQVCHQTYENPARMALADRVKDTRPAADALVKALDVVFLIR